MKKGQNAFKKSFLKQHRKFIGKSAVFKKLLSSYLFIGMILIIALLTATMFIGNSSTQNYLMEKNNAAVGQLVDIVDEFVLGDIPDIAATLSNEIYEDNYSQLYLTGENKNKYTDAHRVKSYLTRVCTLNPAIESIGVFFEASDMYISNQYIRDGETADLYMGERYHYYSSMSNFAGVARWIYNPSFPVASLKNNSVNNVEYIKTLDYSKKIYGSYNGYNAVLFITLRADDIVNILQSSTTGYSDETFIIDTDGAVIACSDNSYESEKLSDHWVSEISRTSKSGSFVDKIGGEEYIVSYSKSGKTDWIYVSYVAVEQVLYVYHFMMRALWIIVGVFILVAVLYSIVCAKRIYKPIDELVTSCAEILPDDVQPSDEYAVIETTISTLHSSLKQQKIIQDSNSAKLTEEYLKNVYRDGVIPGSFEEDLKNCGFVQDYDMNSMIIFVPSADSGITKDETEQLRKSLNTNSSKASVFCAGGDGIVFINYDCSVWTIGDIVGQMMVSLDNGKDCLCAVGTSAKDTELPGVCIERAITAKKYHFIYPEKAIIKYLDVTKNETTKDEDTSDLINEIKQSLKMQDYTKCVTAVDEIINFVRDNRLSFEGTASVLHDIAELLEEHLAGQIFISNKDREEVIGKMERLKGAKHINEYRKVMTSLVNQLFNIYEQYKNGHNLMIVNQARDFVRDNIKNSQLSLGTAAQMIGISSGHLSKLFKAETGVNFSDYISNCRLQYSRELLVASDMKIEQIAELLNYSTPQYFANRFKIKYGCTPKEYRMNFKNRKEE